MPLSFTTQDPVQEIETRLKDEEWLIFEWSPRHLVNLLKAWYFKEGVSEVGAQKVWQDTGHYLYLPRLLNDAVFENAIARGLETEDFFGYASGKEGERYLGFFFGHATHPVVAESALLIECEAARAYQAAIAPLVPDKVQPPVVGPDTGGRAMPPVVTPPGTGSTDQTRGTTKRHFYGTVKLNPVKAKMDFATVVDEVVQIFTLKPGAEVTISVEIQANVPDGFDENLQRAIKQNCGDLKFDNAEFDEG